MNEINFITYIPLVKPEGQAMGVFSSSDGVKYVRR